MDRRRSGVPGSRGPAALPRPVDELPRRLRHPGEVASRALKEETRTCVRRPGRPPLDPAIKKLIVRLGRENPRWGYLRIRGELLKLGTHVSATTIARVLRESRLGPAPRRIGPTWAQFLRLQAYGLLSPDTSLDEDGPEDLAAPQQDLPAPRSGGPGTAEVDRPILDGSPAPMAPPLPSAEAREHASLTPALRRSEPRARDGPPMAA